MSKARQDFYASLSAFSYALDSSDVISKGPDEIMHNERARFLRNGLAISGFAMVEEFVKARTGEVLDRVGSGMTSFGDLPDGLKIASTAGVIKAMQFQANFIEKINLLAHYQNHAKSVASTLKQPYVISNIAFCHNYINLSSSEVDNILTAFRVDNPWGAIGGIISKLGVGVLAPKQAFDNAAGRRHLAAHVINANTEYSALVSYKKESISFCLSYDLLISKALKLLSIKDQDYLKKDKITSQRIGVIYLKQDGGKWKEIKEKAIKAIKSGSDYEIIKADCLLRGKKEGLAVVHTAESGVPIEWFTPDIDF
jgi:hypothetical protein